MARGDTARSVWRLLAVTDYCSEAVRWPNDIVAAKTMALPLKLSALTPRRGSAPNVATTTDFGLCISGVRLLKFGGPRRVVVKKAWASGATIIECSHGSAG